MNWSEFNEAVTGARDTVDKSDIALRMLAGLLVGRLRAARIDGDVLVELKKELRAFNCQTRKWSDAA